MVDIRSATTEIRREKNGRKIEEERKKPQGKNIMACPLPALFHRSAIIIIIIYASVSHYEVLTSEAVMIVTCAL